MVAEENTTLIVQARSRYVTYMGTYAFDVKPRNMFEVTGSIAFDSQVNVCDTHTMMRARVRWGGSG